MNLLGEINPYYLMVWLLLLHWFGDFYCQWRWLADNKSSNIFALMLHVLIYGSVMGVGTILLLVKTEPLYKDPWMIWLILNMVLHLITDAVTSQYTKKYWAEGKTKAFFTMIGFDQFIHGTCLALTTCLFIH
jgi:hypothetical protein